VKLLARRIVQVALAIEEQKLRSTLIQELLFLVSRLPLVIASHCKLAEFVHALFVVLELVNVLLEVLYPLLELMLLQDNLTQLPGSVLRDVFVFVDPLRQVFLECCVSDRLSEINVFKFVVELLDASINHIVNDHAWCHESRLKRLHIGDVIPLFR